MSTWEVLTTNRDGRPSSIDTFVFPIKLPPAPTNNQIFNVLLRHGHIVRRSQRSSYTFDHQGNNIYVLLRGRPEYMLQRVEHMNPRRSKARRHPKAGR